MPYQALYRKYRPNNFDDVVGQDVVIKTLKNAIHLGKTSHAYMFSGPRGVGKTSIAKIFAKTINCLDLKNGNACNECSNCHSILANETTDIIEIDAASNNGVDEIREIRNNINLVPSELKYKVYIIDEVHMLSIGAFNALLKTLEEPPSHVIFILATTDPHKVPITIVSRCQCFEFKRISDSKIVSRLTEICNKENIDIDMEVLEKIAKISEGGMRDALGLLDKVSSYCDGRITIDDFNTIAGVASNSLRLDFIDAVYQKNFLKIIECVDSIYNSGKNFVIFTQDLMDELRNFMLDHYLKKDNSYPIDFLLNFIKKLDSLLIYLKTSNNIRIMFETSILSFINDEITISRHEQIVDSKKETSQNVILTPKNDVNIQKIEEKNLKNKTSDAENSNFTKKVETSNKNFQNDTVRFLIVNNTFATAQKEYLKSLKEKWTKLNDFVLDRSYGAAACYLVDSQLRAVGNQELIITCNYESVLERGLSLLPSMEELLEKLVDKKYKIAILTVQEWETQRLHFIELKNQGKKFEYKEMPIDIMQEENSKKNDIVNSNNTNIDIVQQAISIFGDDIVKIN